MAKLINADDIETLVLKIIYVNQGIEERTPAVEQELKLAEYIYDRIRLMPSVKLRKMTVEECAGHTIEYAMGWKACIDWIRKGGDKLYLHAEQTEPLTKVKSFKK